MIKATLSAVPDETLEFNEWMQRFKCSSKAPFEKVKPPVYHFDSKKFRKSLKRKERKTFSIFGFNFN
jgi:hypothetical protein